MRCEFMYVFNTYFPHDVRLWLVPSSSSSSALSFHRLGFVDVAPTRSDDIQGLVAKVNKKIVHNQVKGQTKSPSEIVLFLRMTLKDRLES